MNAVDGQEDHDGEVGNEQRGVKAVPLVKAAEGLVCRLRPEKMAKPGGGWGVKGQMQRQRKLVEQTRGEIQNGCNRCEQNTPPEDLTGIQPLVHDTAYSVMQNPRMA
jgi:hypothetical protein